MCVAQAPVKPPVDMTGCTVVSRGDGKREGGGGWGGGQDIPGAAYNYAFAVKGGGRRWELWASSAEERAQWLTAFERAGVSSPGASSVDTTDSLGATSGLSDGQAAGGGGGSGGGPSMVTRQNSIRITMERPSLKRQMSLVGAMLSPTSSDVRRAGECGGAHVCECARAHHLAASHPRRAPHRPRGRSVPARMPTQVDV